LRCAVLLLKKNRPPHLGSRNISPIASPVRSDQQSNIDMATPQIPTDLTPLVNKTLDFVDLNKIKTGEPVGAVPASS
jgi:hypothetical protein